MATKKYGTTSKNGAKHSDMKEDKALIKKMVKEKAIKRKK